MKRKLIISVILLVILLLGYLWLRPNQTAAPGTPTQAGHANTPAVQPTTNQSAFDKTQHALTDPASIWVIVDKSHPVQPSSYAPPDLVLPNVSQRLPGATEMKLRTMAATALEHMFAAAQKANVPLIISTAYRGYSYQKSLYDSYVRSDGQTAADTYSARPGYSEHQTGLAVDIRAKSGQCSLDQCFGTIAEGKWLAANAYKYGFLLRYPKDKEAITGYKYEPWHFRYIGTDLSEELRQQGIETLEEFFGVSGGTRYN
jgi:D-alanyl-D-alanine carboxypeptidase